MPQPCKPLPCKESLQPFTFLFQHHIKYQHLLKKKYVCPHPSCGRLFRLQKQLLRHAKHHTGMGRWEEDLSFSLGWWTGQGGKKKNAQGLRWERR